MYLGEVPAKFFFRIFFGGGGGRGRRVWRSRSTEPLVCVVCVRQFYFLFFARAGRLFVCPSPAFRWTLTTTAPPPLSPLVTRPPPNSYATVDEFLHDVRRLCANSFLYSRETSNETVLSFLRKLDADEVKKILTPSKPLVPKWERCLEVSGWAPSFDSYIRRPQVRGSHSSGGESIFFLFFFFFFLSGP